MSALAARYNEGSPQNINNSNTNQDASHCLFAAPPRGAQMALAHVTGAPFGRVNLPVRADAHRFRHRILTLRAVAVAAHRS